MQLPTPPCRYYQHPHVSITNTPHVSITNTPMSVSVFFKDNPAIIKTDDTSDYAETFTALHNGVPIKGNFTHSDKTKTFCHYFPQIICNFVRNRPLANLLRPIRCY